LTSQDQIATTKKDPHPKAAILSLSRGCQEAQGVLGILAQLKPDGKFQFISYASQKLKSHEKNYTPFLLEMSDSVWAMAHYTVYL
jgi:hypothetical protein